jgi:trk system potassium uptake protein TrkH
MLIFIFLIFAITRRSFTTGFNTSYVFRLGKDRELRLAAMAVIIVPLLLFLRHWIGSSDGLGDDSFGQAMRALWGGIFTVLSFLTTTGFISDDWSAAEIWSGLTTPGLVFVGLAITGGGVATTAGGIKLLRVYALYKHGAREIEKLSYPNSVAGSGRLGRRIRREGAYVAWVFFMLFIVSLAVVMVALGGVGLAFEDAMILAIAALSTTGPLADVAGQDPVSYLYISDAAKLILSIAMIVGRMETLVLIALINPTYWRM